MEPYFKVPFFYDTLFGDLDDGTGTFFFDQVDDLILEFLHRICAGCHNDATEIFKIKVYLWKTWLILCTKRNKNRQMERSLIGWEKREPVKS